MVKVIIKKNKLSKFKHQFLYELIAQDIVEQLKIKGETEINVVITNNKKMQQLSKQYKNKDKPTDVLSFENDWEELSKIIGYNMLGDIYISSKKVKEQAKEYNHSTKREWAYLFAHGVMHLCGYDHLTKEDEKIMHSTIERTLNKLGVTRDA